MTVRLALLLGLTLLVTGCAGKNFNDFRVSIGFLSPYDAAVNEYKQGKIMEARARLLAVAKEHEDYKSSREFLKKKVEPARLKLLRYYVRKGKKEESLRHWAQAAEAYKAASTLSIKPQPLVEYYKEANLKARKVRAQAIYDLRKDEDEAWLKWKESYNPPEALLGNDELFAIARQEFEKLSDQRLAKTWELAKKYKLLDIPEMAWIYADSYLRFNARSKDAQDLKNAMSTAIPAVVRVDTSKGRKYSPKRTVRKIPEKDAKVSEAHVRKLIAEKKWKEAREEARALRLQGDKSADKLLTIIDENIDVLANKAFQDGNLAFRLEQINKAVEFWQQAVDWVPDEQTYVDSLRRGMQIQERLEALKSDDNSLDGSDDIGE